MKSFEAYVSNGGEMDIAAWAYAHYQLEGLCAGKTSHVHSIRSLSERLFI